MPRSPKAPVAGAAALTVILLGATAGCGPSAQRSQAASTTTRPAGPATPTATATGAPTTAAPTRPPSAVASAPPQPAPTGTCTTASALASWSVSRLAEQTVVVPVQETDVAAITAEVADGAGGVILFGSQAPASLGAQLAALERPAPGGVVPLVMTDEEGGAVQRMANLVGWLPSARDMAAGMSPAQIRQTVAGVAARMRAAGVTMDLAPVLDLDGGNGPSNSDPDGTRSFGLSAQTATADGLAYAAGLSDAGVLPVVKHFPGLGQASGNTDVMAASTQPWSALQTAGLLPFAAAVRAGLPAVMVANASVPGLTTLPASLSPTVITGVLRGQLGFSGLVLTDSLSATAISAAGYSVPSAAVAAIGAGADMVLFNPGGDVDATTEQIVDAISTAVADGRLSVARLRAAAEHVLAAKRANLCG